MSYHHRVQQYSFYGYVDSYRFRLWFFKGRRQAKPIHPVAQAVLP